MKCISLTTVFFSAWVLVLGNMLPAVGAPPELENIAPTAGPFTGGTPIVLQGNFTRPGEAPLRVLMTNQQDPDPENDLALLVISVRESQIDAITPGIPAPGTFSVYVHVEGEAPSNTTPFHFTTTNEIPIQTLARTLEDNFAAFDVNNDGLLSLEEVTRLFPGLQPELFEMLDTNGDEILSPAELMSTGPVCCCGTPPELLFAGLLGLGGLFAFMLSLMGQALEVLFQLF